MVMMTLQQCYDDAAMQYHLLVTGQATSVVIDQNGEKVTYAATDAPTLLAYLNRLAAQIASGATGLVTAARPH